MPTNTNTYNSRVTDESLERKFRDTFKSQAGAELIDDLYAQGTIVPIVDFTEAALGTDLRQDLQTAWDFSTGSTTVANATDTFISNSGFWKLSARILMRSNATGADIAQIYLTDGLTTRPIFYFQNLSTNTEQSVTQFDYGVVFVRPGQSVVADSSSGDIRLTCEFRQIADLYGNLVNPTGYQSS